jgi:hypothetical protein
VSAVIVVEVQPGRQSGCRAPDSDLRSNGGDTVTMGNLPPGSRGPVQPELARAAERLPGDHGMPGGSRYALRRDGLLSLNSGGTNRLLVPAAGCCATVHHLPGAEVEQVAWRSIQAVASPLPRR